MARRASLIRYRRGVASASAAFMGWVEIYNRAIGPVSSISRIRSTSGHVDVGRGQDFRVDDILVDQLGSRFYTIIQISPNASTDRLLVAEISPPIPDEFESGIVEPFWSVSGTWEMDVAAGTYGSLSDILGVSGYLSTTPLGIPFTYQTVSGDFDVYTLLTVEAGVLTQQKHCLLKAALADDSKCVTVGIRANTQYFTFFRQDVDSSLVLTDAEKIPLAQYAWVRLARVGTRFSAYFSTLTEKQRPTRENDWSEIANSTDVWSSSADVRLGMGFYNDVSNKVFGAEFQFFRNWEMQVGR